jgi:hypothetical protein
MHFTTDAAVKALNTKAPEVAVCLLSKSANGDKVACLTSVPQVKYFLRSAFVRLSHSILIHMRL